MRELKKKIAFTLAEVLIVIGIIGIVAEITIPSLVKDFQRKVYVARLQKSMSVLSQGFKKIMADTGCSDMVCTGVFSGTPADNIQNANVFKIVKLCHMNETGCYDITGRYMNNAAFSIGTKPDKIVLADGSVFSIYNTRSDCSYTAGTNKYSQLCILDGIIDVNGTSPPNVVGRDVFWYYLAKDGSVLPAGMSDDTRFSYWNTAASTYNCLGDGMGYSCFGRIMEKGWQMDY